MDLQQPSAQSRRAMFAPRAFDLRYKYYTEDILHNVSIPGGRRNKNTRRSVVIVTLRLAVCLPLERYSRFNG